MVQADPQLNPKSINEDGFLVIGIQARTSMAKESSPNAVIAKQWGRFMSEGLLSNIPNKADPNIIAVYTDYDPSNGGGYTFLIGAKVNSDSNIPNGMAVIKVPAGRYAVFTTEKGPIEQVVRAEWKAIWALPKSSLGGNRAFKTDFEVYDQRAADPKSSQVEIHVGIK
jgi:predicted transcriptional regulator YdeE